MATTPSEYNATEAEIRSRILYLVGQSGLTQRGFAAAVGMEPWALSKILSAKQRVSSYEVACIAEFAGVTAGWVLAMDEREPRPPRPEPIDWQTVLGPPRDRTLPEMITYLLDAGEADAARLRSLGEKPELERLNAKTESRRTEADVAAQAGNASQLVRLILAYLAEHRSNSPATTGPWFAPKVD